jgi:hypothetical protein
MVTSATLPASAKRRSWVFEAFMERPMLFVYSTKRAAFSISFLTTSPMLLPNCHTFESSLP